LWGRAGLDASLLPLFARHPEPADRQKFLEGLASPQLEVVRACLEGLEKLPGRAEASELLALIQALSRLPAGKEGDALRARLGSHLENLTGLKVGGDGEAWTDWFTKSYPELGKRLSQVDGVGLDAWNKRLARVPFAEGSAGRGREVFIKANCAACHSGAQ